MGRSEAQVPLMTLALLPPGGIPAATDAGVDAGDGAVPTIPLSKSQVEKFFYDDLCCVKAGSCSAAGTPQCCPGLRCSVPDGGGPGSGTCIAACLSPGDICTRDSECCDVELLRCGPVSGRCELRFPPLPG